MFIKIKNICFAKAHVKRMKGRVMSWEKVFANNIYNKEAMPRICKELSNLNTKTKQKQLSN